jgi:RIO kinase 2
MEIAREDGDVVDEEGIDSDSEEEIQEGEEDEEDIVANAEEEDTTDAQNLPQALNQSDPEQNAEEDPEVETSEEDEDETRAERKARKAARPKTQTPHSHNHAHLLHGEKDVKAAVSSELTRQRARQDRRYHSKKSVGKAGRAKGSKMKSDTRVKIGSGGDGWD